MSVKHLIRGIWAWIARALCAVALLWLAPLFGGVQLPSVDSHNAADVAMAQGSEAIQRGDFQTALNDLTEAVEAYRAHSQHNRLVDALNYRGQALQALGHYKTALEDLQRALVLARKIGDLKRVASVIGILGNAYLLEDAIPEARQFIEESISLAQNLGTLRVAAVGLNNLGNLLFREGDYQQALSKYEEVIRLSDKIDSALFLKGLINAARTVAEMDRLEQAEALLMRAEKTSHSLAASHVKGFALVSMGRILQKKAARAPESSARLHLFAYRLFERAEQVALEIGDMRVASYASAYLGQLYESQHRYNEALQLTDRAVFRAQQIRSPELLYRWQWQTGRLLKKQGNIEGATSAYRRAVNSLQTIRQDLMVGTGGANSAFKETVGSLFYELVALLLQQERAAAKQQDKVNYLKEARDTIEALKTAELQDYFLDDCVMALKSKIQALESVAPGTAIIYPILFADRIELLLSISDQMERYTVRVGLDVLTEQVRRFRRRLQQERGGRYLRHSYKLYSWLVRPIEKTLGAQKIDTLVIVPDGPLRTVPMAALHDGEQPLIERYAVVTTPGLTLTDPRPLRPNVVQALGAGLSASVQGYPGLPGVKEELDTIENMYGGTRLQDEAFVLRNVQKELTAKPYAVVHVATHARFESDVRQSFLLTYDSKMSMNQLEELVGLSQYRDQPVELLTLSACQTALGDDRAALGLGGVAVKSGARTALATLWNISDEATSVLISEFYHQLTDPSVSKAEALRQAQLKLLKDPRYGHPAFWSPFLLIGNWL